MEEAAQNCSTVREPQLVHPWAKEGRRTRPTPSTTGAGHPPERAEPTPTGSATRAPETPRVSLFQAASLAHLDQMPTTGANHALEARRLQAAQASPRGCVYYRPGLLPDEGVTDDRTLYYIHREISHLLEDIPTFVGLYAEDDQGNTTRKAASTAAADAVMHIRMVITFLRNLGRCLKHRPCKDQPTETWVLSRIIAKLQGHAARLFSPPELEGGDNMSLLDNVTITDAERQFALSGLTPYLLTIKDVFVKYSYLRKMQDAVLSLRCPAPSGLREFLQSHDSGVRLLRFLGRCPSDQDLRDSLHSSFSKERFAPLRHHLYQTSGIKRPLETMPYPQLIRAIASYFSAVKEEEEDDSDSDRSAEPTVVTFPNGARAAARQAGARRPPRRVRKSVRFNAVMPPQDEPVLEPALAPSSSEDEEIHDTPPEIPLRCLTTSVDPSTQSTTASFECFKDRGGCGAQFSTTIPTTGKAEITCTGCSRSFRINCERLLERRRQDNTPRAPKPQRPPGASGRSAYQQHRNLQKMAGVNLTRTQPNEASSSSDLEADDLAGNE